MPPAVLSDAHLFQTHLEWYDALTNFQRVFQMGSNEPEFYIFAGDMFDYKTSTTTYLPHFRGEEAFVRLRDVFRALDAPIYLLQGNHEKPSVLQGLAQTVENVHYQQGAHWVSGSDREYLLLDTYYRTEGYRDDIVEVFRDLASAATSRTDPILVMHETLGDVPSRLPQAAVDAVAEPFDLVLNGNMHAFERGVGVYGHDHVVNLPSLLPSRRRRGRYWTERYTWTDGVAHTERDSPFGYVSLASDATVTASWFNPSKHIVEVQLDLTDLDITTAQQRLRTMLEEIAAREDHDQFVVYPILTGAAQFSPLLLEDIPDTFDTLHVTEIDRTEVDRVPPTLSSTESTTITIADEDLQEVLLDDTDAIARAVQDDGLHTSTATVAAIVDYVTDPEVDFFGGSTPRIADAVRHFVTDTAARTDADLPEDFETHLTALAEEVKEA